MKYDEIQSNRMADQTCVGMCFGSCFFVLKVGSSVYFLKIFWVQLGGVSALFARVPTSSVGVPACLLPVPACPTHVPLNFAGVPLNFAGVPTNAPIVPGLIRRISRHADGR